jgi:hypothetical protein
VLTGGSTLLWTLSAVYSVTLLISNHLLTSRQPDLEAAQRITWHPATIAAAVAVAALAAWLERRLRTPPEFALGLLVGESTVLATIALNYLVLVEGGDQVDWTMTARVMLVLHLPIAVLEGIVLGFLVGFLARVKPAMLGWQGLDGEIQGRHAHADSVLGNGAPPLASGPGPGDGNRAPRTSPPVDREIPGFAGQPHSDHKLFPGGRASG